jgi:hypothetical protein
VLAKDLLDIPLFMCMEIPSLFDLSGQGDPSDITGISIRYIRILLLGTIFAF